MRPVVFLLRAAWVLLACTALALPAHAAQAYDPDAATEAFRAGNTAYEAGDFAAAEEAYARAAAAGAVDARLYYNRGNALFRLDRLGEAILMYERARLLAPGNADIRHNLEFARGRTVDKIPDSRDDALGRMLHRLQDSYPPAGGTWAALALWGAGFLLLTAALFARGALRTGLRTLAVLAFAALLAFAPSLVWKLHRLQSPNRAVVLDPVAELYSGPGEQYELLFRVHEGTAFHIVERQGEWLTVKLPDGRGGFVRADRIGEP